LEAWQNVSLLIIWIGAWPEVENMNEDTKRQLDKVISDDRTRNRWWLSLLAVVIVLLATGLVLLKDWVLLRHPIHVPDSMVAGMAKQGHF
jgi:hypothetical protein